MNVWTKKIISISISILGGDFIDNIVINCE